MLLSEICHHIEIKFPDKIKDFEVRSLLPPDQATVSDITFVSKLRYAESISQDKRIGLVLVEKNSKLQEYISSQQPCIEVDDLRSCISNIAFLLEKKEEYNANIHISAVIDSSASIGQNVHIGPYTVIGKNVRIGDGSVIDSHVHISDDTTIETNTVILSFVHIHLRTCIGKNIMIYPNCSIGIDGLGFYFRDNKWNRIAHLGRTVIEDDVSIGPGSSIARGSVGDTIIGQGVKIGENVQIGHNVRIDQHTLIAGRTCIAGSTHIGKYCTIGGDCAIPDHICIGDNVTLYAKSAVIGDILKSGYYGGMPAVPSKTFKRNLLALAGIGEIHKTIVKIQKYMKRAGIKI